MKTHNIKLNINFCDAVCKGEKTFEIRENDRGYQKGDYIKFTPVNGIGLHLYHEVEDKKYIITYVLNGWGVKENHVVFSIKEVLK